MAMSRKWKIVGSVLAALALVAVIGIAGLIYVVQMMRSTAETMYGGPLPANVSPILAIKLEKARMAVFLDRNSQVPVVILENPATGNASKPLSEPDVRKALDTLEKSQREIQNSLEGSTSGTPSTLTVHGKTIHTLKNASNSGQHSEVGVLNLDGTQLVFMASTPQSEDPSPAITRFLSQMPLLQNDSHLKK